MMLRWEKNNDDHSFESLSVNQLSAELFAIAIAVKTPNLEPILSKFDNQSNWN